MIHMTRTSPDCTPTVAATVPPARNVPPMTSEFPTASLPTGYHAPLSLPGSGIKPATPLGPNLKVAATAVLHGVETVLSRNFSGMSSAAKFLPVGLAFSVVGAAIGAIPPINEMLVSRFGDAGTSNLMLLPIGAALAVGYLKGVFFPSR